MPKAARGPRLELYGPDRRHGARPKRGFSRYCYYIVWYEGVRRRERSCGTAVLGEAQARLAEVIGELARALQAKGPRPPERMMIAEAIALYAEQHGPHAAAPERIAHAGSALLDWWGEATIAEITPQACRRYVEERKAQIATG
ncbi:MAG: hypothetical protein HQL39_15505, partial [Alphaproteobacteria bacterium]|nr:hypothetical protein [Alphaproteobacteria bacterium]